MKNKQKCAALTLYISDLDGTLLNNAGSLSLFARDGLNKLINAGLCFTVATARGFASTSVVLEGLNLTIPLVLMNGAVIFDPVNKKPEIIHILAKETSAAVIDTFRLFNVTGFMYTYEDNMFRTYHETSVNAPLKEFIKDRIKRYEASFYHKDTFDDAHSSAFYFTLLDEYDTLFPVKQALENIPDITINFYKDNYNKGLWYLELAAACASKKHAAEYIKTAHNFSKIICFGDNTNDIPLFEAADYRIAAENAVPELKAMADTICDTNENDGVIKWLIQNCGIY